MSPKRFSELTGAARANAARRDRIEACRRELLAELSLADLRRSHPDRELRESGC